MLVSAQPSIYDPTHVDRVRRALGIDPQAVRRLRIKLLKHFAGREAALQELPAERRDEFAQRIGLRSLRIEQRLDSSIDGATKLVMQTEQGRRIESILLRADSGRVALCISCQVGCAANCDFCATGKMGLIANLSAAEILDQVVLAGELLAEEGRKVRNIVFMGMGEPLHNTVEVSRAIECLIASDYFHHPPTRVLVSTVGIPREMIRLAEAFPQINQALSLHSVRQSVREQIIPLAKRYPLPELRDTVTKIAEQTGRSVMLEYLMLAGLNDSLDDADDLIEWTEGLHVHLNLIPFNPIAGASHLNGSERPVREAFANRLKAAGRTTTLRYSMGADIDAACGQLVRKLVREGARVPAMATTTDSSS